MTEPRPSRRSHGALEAAVLRSVWESDTARTVGEIQRSLGIDVAYNTVLTVLARLHAKGLVVREPDGRAHRYRPMPARAGDVAEQMERDLRTADDRLAALSQFVGQLDADELAELRRLLEDVESP